MKNCFIEENENEVFVKEPVRVGLYRLGWRRRGNNELEPIRQLSFRRALNILRTPLDVCDRRTTK